MVRHKRRFWDSISRSQEVDIECEGVTSIIGSYQSTVTSSVSLLTEVLKVPYVSPDADAVC